MTVNSNKILILINPHRINLFRIRSSPLILIKLDAVLHEMKESAKKKIRSAPQIEILSIKINDYIEIRKSISDEM